jgi:hypothetical protein
MTADFPVTANFEGTMRATIWHKKSAKELAKLREKHKGELLDLPYPFFS